MSRNLRSTIWLVVALAAAAVPLHAVNYTITGRVKTNTGAHSGNDNIVQFIKVIARDQGVLFDTDEGSAYTAADGTFSMTFNFTILGVGVPINLYMNILYQGTALDGHFIKVRIKGGDGSTILDSNVEGFVHVSLPGGTYNLGILRTFSTKANIVTHHGQALRFMRSQYAGWLQPDDLLADAGPADGDTSVAGDGSHSTIELGDYDDPGSAPGLNFSNIHHETWHWIAYRAYGNRGIANNCNNGQSHSSRLESCEGFAMQEGGAQYFGNQSFLSFYPGGDNQTAIPGATDWRGRDLTGFQNSGEIVEGALHRVWRLDADNPGQLQVHATAAADTFKAWKDAYVTLKGATSAAVLTMFNNAADNGIVYTRGWISTFSETAPPNAGPPSAGNYKLIGGIPFLRGTVTPTIQQLTAPQLNLGRYSAIIPADQKDLGYKEAVNGLNEAATNTFTYIGAVAIASPLTWNTANVADNDYDLLVRMRNAHTWLDTFSPDFTGDGTATVNTNEKWLKYLGTWWSLETPAATDNKGKVIVDNKSPTVTNMKPQ